MNPLKCVFGVHARDFLGFVVHKKGIEINQNKTKAILNLKPPLTKKQIQSLLGNINFLRRFISNLSDKTTIFSPLLKIKKESDFHCGREQQEAFDAIKEYLTKPLILLPHSRDNNIRLYIDVSDTTIGSMLAQEDDNGVKRPIYYLSRILIDAETRYNVIEKTVHMLVLLMYEIKAIYKTS